MLEAGCVKPNKNVQKNMEERMVKRVLASLSISAAMVMAAGAANADWPEKPIKFVVPYSTGGGFDVYVRAVAPEMEKILGVPVVPENIPGAGGQKGAAAVYKADPDGYTIGIFNVPGLTVPQLLGKKVAYDLDKVTWLGNLAKDTYSIAVKADSSINSLKDLCSLGRPAKFSDTGPASTSSVTAKISMSLIDCPMTNVTGYKGSSQTIVAAMRGEVDATLKPIGSLRKYVKSGDMKFIVTYENKPSIKGVPSSRELGHNEFEKLTLYRIVGGPPGLPKDVANKLADALLRAANSEAVKEWSTKSKKPLDPIGGDEATVLMKDLSDFYSKYKSILAN